VEKNRRRRALNATHRRAMGLRSGQRTAKAGTDNPPPPPTQLSSRLVQQGVGQNDHVVPGKHRQAFGGKQAFITSVLRIGAQMRCCQRVLPASGNNAGLFKLSAGISWQIRRPHFGAALLSMQGRAGGSTLSAHSAGTMATSGQGRKFLWLCLRARAWPDNV
jgi:hypothetical protein